MHESALLKHGVRAVPGAINSHIVYVGSNSLQDVLAKHLVKSCLLGGIDLIVLFFAVIVIIISAVFHCHYHFGCYKDLITNNLLNLRAGSAGSLRSNPHSHVSDL